MLRLLKIENGLYAMAFAVANQPLGSAPKIETANVIVAAADNSKSFIVTIHTCGHVLIGGQMIPLKIAIFTVQSKIAMLFVDDSAHKNVVGT